MGRGVLSRMLSPSPPHSQTPKSHNLGMSWVSSRSSTSQHKIYFTTRNRNGLRLPPFWRRTTLVEVNKYQTDGKPCESLWCLLFPLLIMMTGCFRFLIKTAFCPLRASSSSSSPRSNINNRKCFVSLFAWTCATIFT